MEVEATVQGFTVFEDLRGPEKTRPVLEALHEAFPTMGFTIEPVCIDNPWNQRWEHKVTVRRLRVKKMTRE